MYLCATFWSSKSCIYLSGWQARSGQDKMTWVSPRCSMTQKISNRHQYNIGDFKMKRKTPKVQNGIPILTNWDFFVKEFWSFKVRFEVHQTMFRSNYLWLNVSTRRNHVVYNQPICNWMQLIVACNSSSCMCKYIWILDDFYHLCSYGPTSFPFILQNGWFLHFDYILLYIQCHLYI